MYYFGLFIKKTLRLLLKPLSFVPAIVMMYVIFNFSAQDGTTSAALSLKVTQKIVYEMDTVLDMGWSSDEEAAHVEQLHYYVRKMGHVT